jgi:hypothetical protein
MVAHPLPLYHFGNPSENAYVCDADEACELSYHSPLS